MFIFWFVYFFDSVSNAKMTVYRFAFACNFQKDISEIFNIYNPVLRTSAVAFVLLPCRGFFNLLYVLHSLCFCQLFPHYASKGLFFSADVVEWGLCEEHMSSPFVFAFLLSFCTSWVNR